MHSVGLEPTKLILIGTRTTYQATGDAGLVERTSPERRSHAPPPLGKVNAVLHF